MPLLFTIGHSRHTPDAFVSLLTQNGVSAVADVRSVPWSRHAPWFQQQHLRSFLADASLAYVPMGDQLGGRPQNPALLNHNGRPNYLAVSSSAPFLQGINRLLRGAASHTIALLCAEADPLSCHRSRLVAPALLQHGGVVRHIKSDGSIETHQQLLARRRNAPLFDKPPT